VAPGRAVRIRLVVAPLLVAGLLGVLWVHHATGSPLVTDLLLLGLGAGAAWEMSRLLAASGRPVDVPVAVLASGLLAGLGLLAPAAPSLRMDLRAGLVIAALVALLLRRLCDVRPEAVQRIAHSLLPVLYVGLLLSFTREAAGEPASAGLLAWVVLTSKASDVGGWVVGKPFGRHKMIPSVSPGKSWEGLAGGLACSALVALLLPGPLGIEPAGWTAPRRVLFGLAIGQASVLAGVTWSGWKRRLGAKDSSRLLPEMGGVLDLVDSLLLAGPAAWLWFRLGL
jgi:phosphatidate cytidylyltransferase